MSSSALLVMDVLRGLVDRYAGSSPGLLDRLAAATHAARTHDVPVVYVRFSLRDGAPEASRRNRIFGALAGRSVFGDDDEATQVHPAVAPRPGDPVVLKKRVSAFTGSDLEVLLRSTEVTHLVLTGIATSGVVLSTLRQAADLDYRLTVLRDACADDDEEVHRVLLDKVFPRQAEVLTVEQWAAAPGG